MYNAIKKKVVVAQYFYAIIIGGMRSSVMNASYLSTLWRFTSMSMIKRIIILFILIPAIMLFSYLPAVASVPFRDVVAEAAVLAEVDSGTILFGHNKNLRHPADALARVMTLLLAVSAVDEGIVGEDELITMTEYAWEDITNRNTTLRINPGEIMPFRDLMFAAFVGSAAEACNMIAERVAGSTDAFVTMMNERALQLGAENTRFTNTHGLFDEDQFTTAYDQFLIFREASGNELFMEIAGVFRYVIDETNSSDVRRLLGTNSLLNQNGRYFYRHNKAGMAGNTFEGGHSYVGISEVDGMSLVAVVLGSDEIMLADESFDMRNLSEARRLFEWGFNQFGWHTILGTTTLVDRAPVTHGAGADYVNLRAEIELRLLIGNDVSLDDFTREVVIFSIRDDEPLIAPIEAGDVLGYITLYRDGEEFGPINLIANVGVELHNFEFMRRQVMDVVSHPIARYVIWGLAFIIFIYFALIVRYNVKRRKRLTRIAQAKRQLAEEHRQATEAHEQERAAYYNLNQNTHSGFNRRPYQDDGFSHTSGNGFGHTSGGGFRHAPDNGFRHSPDNGFRHAPDNRNRRPPPRN